jgi:hypothetical protein
VELQPNYGNIYSTQGKQVDSETLAKRWNIDQLKALNTAKQTTQHGVCSCLYPALSWYMTTNDMMLQYNRLLHPLFSNAMKAGVLSVCGNTYVHASCTQYGLSRVHPMVKKGDAYEALSLVFKRNTLPPQTVVNNPKE